MEWKSKCRACLNEESEMHCLYNELEHGLTLADILKQNMQCEVDKDGDFSSFLCVSCTKTLIDFHNFRIIYLDNEQQIRKLLAQKELDVKAASEDLNKNASNCENINKESASVKDSVNENSEDNNVVEIVIKEESVVDKDARLIIDGATESKDLFLNLQCDTSVISEKSKIKRRYVKMRSIQDGIRCPFCKQYFPDKPTLKEHTNIHRTHVCDVCGAAFTRKTYLMDHLEVHDGQCKHVCNFCGKAFRRRTVLVKHRRIHTHPRECVCEMCGKRFNDKGTLKTHIMLIHTKERRFVCTTCNATFPLKATLEKHMKRHEDTNEKEFICDVCNTAYRDKSSLRRHVQTKHEEVQTKQICLCAKAYSSKEALMKHRKKCSSLKAMLGEAFAAEEEEINKCEQKFEVVIC